VDSTSATNRLLRARRWWWRPPAARARAIGNNKHCRDRIRNHDAPRAQQQAAARRVPTLSVPCRGGTAEQSMSWWQDCP
jgi:hypothetical protein